MQLTAARILNFKSVLDSDWFSIGELTCLVGKNESGKTAVLEALEKLHSVIPEREALRNTEYPRMNWSEYEESTEADIAVETKWILSEDESAHLVKLAGIQAAVTSNEVCLTKDYNNDLEWGLPLNLEDVVRHAVETSGLTDDEKTPLFGHKLTSDLIKALQELEAPSARQQAMLAELNERWPDGGLQLTAKKYLLSRLPRFVYYSQYDRLPGRISLDQLLQAQSVGSLDDLPGSRIFLALLSMVGTTPQDISQIATSEELISKLEAVETRVSKKIFTYWSQNKQLKVRFRFDQAVAGDPAPFNTGKIFQTRIENTRHQATIRLDERSTGFIWFFSFLVWFSEVQRQHGDNLVVLLDEPGLSLHATAQSDLLRYVKTELVPKYQVLYTTHSPFMIDSTDLFTCRTVEDATGLEGEILGTKVGDQVLSRDHDTLFPLQAALGYDITQTLFIGEHCLLVEGPSDLLYLTWASDQLRSRNRTHLDPRWTITPCGGITKVPSFMALFGGSNLHVAVLTDHGQGDKKKVREIRESNLLKDGHVLTADTYAGDQTDADVEDIIGRPLFTKLVEATYSLSPDQSFPVDQPPDAPSRVTLEAESVFRGLPADIAEYDHFAPARYLIEHPNDFADQVDDTLDRFEVLFRDLNSLL